MFADEPKKEERIELTPLPPDGSPSRLVRGAVNRHAETITPAEKKAAPDDPGEKLQNYILPRLFLFGGGLLDLLLKCSQFGLAPGLSRFAIDMIGNTAILLLAAAFMKWYRSLNLGPFLMVLFKLAAIVAFVTVVEDLITLIINGHIIYGAVIFLAVPIFICRFGLNLLFDVNDEDSWLWAVLYVVLMLIFRWQIFGFLVEPIRHM